MTTLVASPNTSLPALSRVKPISSLITVPALQINNLNFQKWIIFDQIIPSYTGHFTNDIHVMVEKFLGANMEVH